MHKGRSFSKIENLGNFGLKILGISDFSSAIILAIISFLSGLGWMLDRKKHRQEIESLKADNRMKDMELGKAYVDEFRSNIARPLQEEVKDWLSPSSFAPRQIERARLRSVWRRFANGDSPAEECDPTD